MSFGIWIPAMRFWRLFVCAKWPQMKRRKQKTPTEINVVLTPRFGTRMSAPVGASAPPSIGRWSVGMEGKRGRAAMRPAKRYVFAKVRRTFCILEGHCLFRRIACGFPRHRTRGTSGGRSPKMWGRWATFFLHANWMPHLDPVGPQELAGDGSGNDARDLRDSPKEPPSIPTTAPSSAP